MRKLFLLVLLVISISTIKGQELNALVVVNAERIQNSNQQIFASLQKDLSEYINTTVWTNNNYKSQEKINCTFTLNILENPSTNEFKGNIQIQTNRPVYNSSYQTSLLNYKDDQLNFTYREFQPLRYNENSFESNLVSIVTFYVYTIIGLDGDSFALKGGQPYHELAEKVINIAQQGGYAGWNRIDGNYTRYQLNENLLSPTFESYRTLLYDYHIKGMDLMSSDKKEAKKNIANAVGILNNIYTRRSNAYLLRVFMDTKSNELVDVFSDGPKVNEELKLKETLLKVYPNYRDKWKKL